MSPSCRQTQRWKRAFCWISAEFIEVVIGVYKSAVRFGDKFPSEEHVVEERGAQPEGIFQSPNPAFPPSNPFFTNIQEGEENAQFPGRYFLSS